MKTFNPSRKQFSLAVLVVALIGVIALSFSLAATTPQIYYVSTDGIDTNAGTAQTTPFKTIQKAAIVAKNGDTILVNSGVYYEKVTLNTASGVTIRGYGPTKPIIDGGNVRSVGLELGNGVHDMIVSNFEIRNLTAGGTGRAAGIVSYSMHHVTIENMDIHDMHATNLYSYGMVLGTNDSPGIVHDVTIRNNRIHDIGPGGESMGIWLLYTRDMTLDGNEIYRVRKEGIRDWVGLNNVMVNNRTYLNWIGINLEDSTGTLVANNVSYYNVYGYNPKHVSSTHALNTWGLSTGLWSKFWHNTSYANSHADIGLGMNAPNQDYIDVRNNIFASPGDVHLHDFPSSRGSNIIMDGNAYSGSAPIYYATWNSPHVPKYNDLTSLTANLGWETHGQNFIPVFKNPAVGDFSFNVSGLAAGINLGGTYGTQVGARGTAPATNSWTPYPATVIASSPLAGTLNKQNASDGTDDRYWWSSNYNTNGWAVLDLGSPKAMNGFVMDVFAHGEIRTPKAITIQISDDNVNYSTAFATTNPDSFGSSYNYTLASPVTARYVKFNMLNTFGGTTLLMSDFRAGLLAPVEPPAPNQPPTVSITAPNTGASFEELAAIPITATASDPDGSITKVEFFRGNTKLGEDTTAPYQYTWFGATEGDYDLTVKATDDAGETTISDPATIHVTASTVPPAPTCTVIGDVNCDEKVDFLDLSALLIKITTSDSKTDFNQDGTVDFRDLSYLLSRFTN